MKHGARLIGGGVLVCAIGAIVSGIGVYETARIEANVVTGYRFDLVGLKLTQQANADVLKAGRSLRKFILTPSAVQRAGFTTEAKRDLASLARGNLDQTETVRDTEMGQETFSAFGQNWLDCIQAFMEMKYRNNTVWLQDRDGPTDMFSETEN